MNTNGHTIRRGFAAFAAATAFFAFAACGTEISPPTQDIGGAQQKHTRAPEQPTKTDAARQDFGDEYGNADPGRSNEGRIDAIDRTKDWH